MTGASKVQKKLPKRCRNEKLKARRSTSWNKSRRAKDVRIAEQQAQEKHNLQIGCTGKMRRYNKLHSAACERGNHVPKASTGVTFA